MESLIFVYKHQRENHVDNNIYKLSQCDFAYNSNHIEGSKLTHDQTRMIYERNIISGTANVDDVIETKNHFILFDYMLDTYDQVLDHDYIKSLHQILKGNTSQSKSEQNAVGDYKIHENIIGDLIPTVLPKDVFSNMDFLIESYNKLPMRTLDDIIDFHYRFEKIHPFSDGNGRVGRMIMFKECLNNDIMPFIITEDLRDFYIRGLQNYPIEKGYLRDTCLTAQDRFSEKYYPLAMSYYDIVNNCKEKPVENELDEPDADGDYCL